MAEPNQTEAAECARRWAGRLGDGYPYPTAHIIASAYLREKWESCEDYLADHRNCARAFRHAWGHDRGDARGVDGLWLWDAWGRALNTPTAAMIELDAVLVALEQENQTND